MIFWRLCFFAELRWYAIVRLSFERSTCHRIAHTHRHLGCMQTTENEVLFILAAKSCVWVPWGVFSANNKRYLSILFVSAIARLKQLSQVLARATVSTFVQIDGVATVLCQKELKYAWFWLLFRRCSVRCWDGHVLCMSNNFCERHFGLTTPLLYGACSFKHRKP